MAIFIQTNQALDGLLAHQAVEAASRRQELFEMTRQCQGTSDALGDVHEDQAAVHLMTSIASALMLIAAAACIAAGRSEGAQILSTVGSTIVPQASRSWTQDGDRKLQGLNFKLKAHEQQRQERQSDTGRQLEEMARQLAIELMRLYAGLYKFGQ